MTDPDDDLPSASVLTRVLGFAVRRWLFMPRLTAACAGFMLLATVTEVFVPLFAGRMIDAVAHGARGPAWHAFGAAMVVLRYASWRAIIPLSLRIMADVTQEAFARVQRLSARWHPDSLSVSTVRQITRGMWALDTLDDTLLLSLLPSFSVLVGTVMLMAVRWPLLGLVTGVGAAVYVVVTVGLATPVLAPIAQASNRQDTKIGGVLADAIGNNAVGKVFGAEEREEEQLAGVIARWHVATRRTWMAFTWVGSGQLALLWLVRTAITGAGLWLWSSGRANAGDIAFVVTSYLVLHGYLRDIGQQVQTLQRSANELEVVVDLLVQDAMMRLMNGRTTLVIAHRLSTVRALDRILVFDAGRIVEDGSHDDLLAAGEGIYRRLLERQAGATAPELADR